MLYRTKLWIGVATCTSIIGGGIYCFTLKPPNKKNLRSKNGALNDKDAEGENDGTEEASES